VNVVREGFQRRDVETVDGVCEAVLGVAILSIQVVDDRGKGRKRIVKVQSAATTDEVVRIRNTEIDDLSAVL
jgi:hypothetical protein